MATPMCKSLTVIDDTGKTVTRTTTYLPIYSEERKGSSSLCLSSLPHNLRRIFKKAGNNFYMLWEMLEDLASYHPTEIGTRESDIGPNYLKWLCIVDSIMNEIKITYP